MKKPRRRDEKPRLSYPKEQTVKGAFGRNLNRMNLADAKKLTR